MSLCVPRITLGTQQILVVLVTIEITSLNLGEGSC